MLNENLIATLEQSLRQTRNAQNRLVARLREVETEADSLKQEITALENSASQTEAAIYSLLATMGSGKQAWNMPPNAQYEAEEYERPIARQSYGNHQMVNNGGGYSPSLSYMNKPRQKPMVSNIEPISHRFSDRTITQACTLLLRESGKPMHVNELYNMLQAGGFEFTGNNPTISIAVSLSRNRRFHKVAPGTFDLVIRDASQAS